MNDKTDAVVTMRNLSFSYPDGTQVFESLDFDVNRGETLGIIGPNGAGKSTFLLHLNGIYQGRGSLRVLGMEVSGKTIPTIRRKVGLVFQDPETQLFMPTVLDDVAFGPLNLGLSKEEARKAALEALGKVQMSDCSHKCPHHLSLGQKKRAAIAAVLAMSPELIVFDEPTSNLDPRQRRVFIDFVRNLEETVIVATHDLEMVLDLCTRLVLLNAGRIIAEGPPRQILLNRALLEEHSMEVPLSLALRP